MLHMRAQRILSNDPIEQPWFGTFLASTLERKSFVISLPDYRFRLEEKVRRKVGLFEKCTGIHLKFHVN